MISEKGRAALEAVHGGALGWSAHWARITVSQASADVVTVSPGEYHASEKVYFGVDPITVNLQTYKPAVANDERWIALILRGADVEVNQVRAFETSEEPLTESIPVNQPTPKISGRRMSVVIQTGEFAPPPALRPSINENDCCIAFVRLKSTGIQEIVANDDGRVKTVAEIDGRLVAIEVKVEQLFKRAEALETNIAAVAAAQKNFATRALASQLTRDVGRMSQLMNFPDEARNYYFDQGLVKDFWDLQHVDSIARIKEGVRYQYASIQNNPLRLLDYGNAELSIYDGRIVLPKFTEVTRIESPLGSGSLDLSNTVHTVVTATQHTVSYESIRYGATINVCENTAGWESIGDRKPGEIFAVNGQEFVSGGLSGNPWNENPASEGHKNFSATGIIRDYYSETYTTYHTEYFGLSGAIHAQSFLNAQLMVCTSFEFYFDRVGSGAGSDVTLCVVKLNSAGAPDYDAVIAKMTKPQGELNTGWCKFVIPPTLLDTGKRYAAVLVTGGNHAIKTSTGNAFTGGTKFVCTDGIWSQGSTTEDICMRVNGAKFERSRTVIEMEAATLADGMTEMQLVFQGWEPDGTQRSWEIKPVGSAVWIPFDNRAPNPLANLPPQAQLRCIMQGTEDIAPCLILDATNARVLTGRMQGIQRAISKQLNFGFSTTQLQMVAQVDNYDPARHTHLNKIMVGATVVTGTVVAEQDITKPSRWKFTTNFTLGAAATSCRIRLEGTTNSIVVVPFVQDIQLNAF
ncbi:hypothetical protein P7F60_28995 [Rhizobium sp. YJ-22]|uniref:hypothetical protein n=1 Tax=Rhizobium sp. YJ-22 TaxID=3037556 RepID=UPI00241224F8|nr:hypothetical protein [Rhizobium sp. YJ-22]MDG3580421.1 hypothetical protein [Rhizobium sp. YJ-22]